MNKPIALKNEPKDKEFEEFLSAYFQAAGNYTERNIIERDVTEVLELDTIIYDYSDKIPKSTLIEIKSGKWGFPEIFKVYGWKEYLGINKAIFITCTSKGSDEIDQFYKEKSREIGVDLCIIKDQSQTQLYIAEHLNNTTFATSDIEHWRFSFWIEREIFKKLCHSRKSNPSSIRYERMMDYYNHLNNGVFFIENLLDRIKAIYQKYQSNSSLISRVATEITEGCFDAKKIQKELFEKTFYQCEFNDLIIATYIEYKSRLCILKNIVDYIQLKAENVQSERIEDTERFLNFDFSKFDFLPDDMRARIKTLEGHKYLRLYPYFWQQFMWVFGGFILLDYKTREYAEISKRTGIPTEEIDNAFEAYEIIFPARTKWMTKSGKSNILQLKLFPHVFMGVGANLRKDLYAENKEYSGLDLSEAWTELDLVKWNNSTYKILNESQAN